MILSYETLLSKWVNEKDYQSLIQLRKNKTIDMNYFLEKNAIQLIELASKKRCSKTSASLLLCFESSFIKSISDEELSQNAIDMISEYFVDSEGCIDTWSVVSTSEASRMKAKYKLFTV
ncbi:hypothetical protein [Photobacterium kishitanii]|uniref:Uncharacterized protein n=1 Tax=Photobacterium kishitanii TaxID=318456 RepID=A0A2T3KMV9_9GAMM|nr:hypothetical protein [Photobacterium kishitanii]PSV01147.1 hypothetical protein C9J27_03750 [Photobacterium kishitanii]